MLQAPLDVFDGVVVSEDDSNSEVTSPDADCVVFVSVEGAVDV
jgi:hypothetical protein